MRMKKFFSNSILRCWMSTSMSTSLPPRLPLPPLPRLPSRTAFLMPLKWFWVNSAEREEGDANLEVKEQVTGVERTEVAVSSLAWPVGILGQGRSDEEEAHEESEDDKLGGLHDE